MSYVRTLISQTNYTRPRCSWSWRGSFSIRKPRTRDNFDNGVRMQQHFRSRKALTMPSIIKSFELTRKSDFFVFIASFPAWDGRSRLSCDHNPAVKRRLSQYCIHPSRRFYGSFSYLDGPEIILHRSFPIKKDKLFRTANWQFFSFSCIIVESYR